MWVSGSVLYNCTGFLVCTKLGPDTRGSCALRVKYFVRFELSLSLSFRVLSRIILAPVSSLSLSLGKRSVAELCVSWTLGPGKRRKNRMGESKRTEWKGAVAEPSSVFFLLFLSLSLSLPSFTLLSRVLSALSLEVRRVGLCFWFSLSRFHRQPSFSISLSLAPILYYIVHENSTRLVHHPIAKAHSLIPLSFSLSPYFDRETSRSVFVLIFSLVTAVAGIHSLVPSSLTLSLSLSLSSHTLSLLFCP